MLSMESIHGSLLALDISLDNFLGIAIEVMPQ